MAVGHLLIKFGSKIIHCVADGLETFCIVIGNLDVEFLFNLHHKFNNVQGGSERPITDIIYFASAWDLYGEGK